MVLSFKIENFVAAQAYILVAVSEGEGLSALAEQKLQVVMGFFEVVFFNGLAQKPDGAAFETFVHVLAMAGDKDDEHGVVDAFQGIGNLKAFFFTFSFPGREKRRRSVGVAARRLQGVRLHDQKSRLLHRLRRDIFLYLLLHNRHRHTKRYA